MAEFTPLYCADCCCQLVTTNNPEGKWKLIDECVYGHESCNKILERDRPAYEKAYKDIPPDAPIILDIIVGLGN